MKNKISKLIFALMVPAMFVVGLFCCLNPFLAATATTLHGGAVYVGKGSLYTMNGGSISNAKSEYGGGVMVVGGNFNFQNGTISNNAAVSWHGGGVYVWNNGQMTMTNGIIQNNTSTYNGAGIMISDNSTVLLSGGQIINNTASGRAGGVCVGVSSKLYFSGGTISGNNSVSVGGGVLIDETSTMQMTGGTICDNTAKTSGADLYNYGTFVMNDGTIGKANATSNADAIVNEGTMSIYGGNVYDNISSSATIYTKKAANIYGTIAITNANAKIIVEDWGGIVPSYTVKPFALDKVFMVLKGGDSEPDLSTLTIKGFTLSNNVYLKSEKNSDGNWEISVSERVSNVSFNPGKGTCDTESISVDYETAYGTLPTPYLRGYRFTGWSRNYFTMANYTGSYQGVASAGKITLTPAKTNTRAAFQIQMWNNDSLIETNGGTMLWAESTGHFNEVFTKTEELKQIYFRLNANADDAYVIYDIQDLVNGHTYVVSLDVVEYGVNKIVVQNIMIEENSKNIETTYTSSYVTETTINDQFYNHTLFAKYTEATVKVVVANLSGSKTEGTVMGSTLGSRTYTKKIGETITIKYKSRGVYTFAKVVKGTTFDSSELTNLTYTITEDDLNQETIYFTVCYTLTVNVYAVCGGVIGSDTGGTVSINNGTKSGFASEVLPYTGINQTLTVQSDVKSSDGFMFRGWFENGACYNYSQNLSTNDIISVASWNGDINLFAKFTDIESVSDHRNIIWGKDWLDYYPPHTHNDKLLIQMIQFRTSSSITSQNNEYNHRTELAKCLHGKTFSGNDRMADQYGAIYIKTCPDETCVQFYSKNDFTIYADEDMSSCFAGMPALRKIVFENFDTSNTKNMSEMFAGDNSLERADLSVFNTDRVTNFDRMFYDCGRIEILNLSSFVMHPWATAEDMFTKTRLINKLYTPQYCAINVTLPTEMFDYVNTTLQDTDYASDAEAGYGPYTYLPNGESGSRYYTKTRSSPFGYVEFTSDIISALTASYELPAGSELRIKFDFNEPDLCFGWQNISNMSLVQVYLKDIGKVYEFTIASPKFFKFNEQKLFYKINNSIKSKIKLTSLKFINVCTDGNKDMEAMFQNCEYLETVEGLQNFHFIGVKSMREMFGGCSVLSYVNMANAKTFNNISAMTGGMGGMFIDCSNLQIVDMENMIVSYADDMFDGCIHMQVFVSPAECSIGLGGETADYVDRNGKTVSALDATGTSVTIYCPENLRYQTTSAISSNKNERLELSKFFNNFSVFAMVCVSALAYPYMNDKKRKQNF